VGIQEDTFIGPYALGQCIKCSSTIGFPNDEQRAALGMEEP
jgi:hypothetical protein